MTLATTTTRWWVCAFGTAVLISALGCGKDSSGGNPVEPNVGFLCRGSVSDGAGDTVLLPSGASNLPPLDICDPLNISSADAITKCTDKCNGMLQGYADAINARGGTMVTVGQLTCSIQQFEQINSDCPNMDPPGVPEPPFSGGPSQYVANLTGNLHFAVDVNVAIGSVTVSRDTPATGQLGYTIIPLDRNCPPQGCDLLITSLSVAVADFDIAASILGVTIFEDSIRGMHIQNAGWVTGTWHPDGHFEVPAQAGNIVVTLSDNGTHTSLDRKNGNPLTGTIDPVAGTVAFDTFAQSESDTTITLGNFAGANVSNPPTAVIATPATVECNTPGAATVLLDGTPSASASGPLHFFSWRVNSGPVLSGAQVPATLHLGPNDVALNVFNQAFGIGVAERLITVVDTTPPTFAPLAPVTATLCDPGSQSAEIATPTAGDVCSPTVVVTGQVIASNGVALAVPVPIVNGRVQLPAGIHLLRWTAIDPSGQSATTTQTLNIRSGLQAGNTITIADRARVALRGSGFALLGNTGSGPIEIGVQGQTGGLVTGGGVLLRDRAVVNGSILHAGALTRQNLTTVTGAIIQTPLSLPPGRDLAGVVFPATNAGAIVVSPDGTRVLAPGAYAAVTVFSRGRLKLSSGTYLVTSLDLEPRSRLELDQTAGPVQIFVQSGLVARGQIAPMAGAPGGFLLGYAGSQPVTLGTPFLAGTLVAPGAKIVIPSLGAGAFSGELFARDIEVQPDATLTCDPLGRTAQQAGL